MSKILITGSKGFIGSHLMAMFPDATGWDLENDEAELQEDITERLPDEDFDYIFHLAAFKSVSKSQRYPKEFILNNCWGTTNIITRYPKARIINISSSAANECRSIYGMTKYFGELVGNTHANCLNVRLYNVFGEGQPLNGAVVPHFCKTRVYGGNPIIYGDGMQMRDLTYVGDVVEELKRLMFATKETGLHHLGCSNPMAILDLCRLICGNATVDFQPKRSYDIEYSCAPSPMHMTYGREEGLKRTIAWWEKTKKDQDDSFSS